MWAVLLSAFTIVVVVIRLSCCPVCQRSSVGGRLCKRWLLGAVCGYELLLLHLLALPLLLYNVSDRRHVRGGKGWGRPARYGVEKWKEGPLYDRACSLQPATEEADHPAHRRRMSTGAGECRRLRSRVR